MLRERGAEVPDPVAEAAFAVVGEQGRADDDHRCRISAARLAGDVDLLPQSHPQSFGGHGTEHDLARTHGLTAGTQ